MFSLLFRLYFFMPLSSLCVSVAFVESEDNLPSCGVLKLQVRI